MEHKILALVGGISSRSLNEKLFIAVKEQSISAMESFDISKLPYFSQDIENDPPPVVKDLKSQVKDADAVLIITPEYNRSFPGVLKNAVDWISRPMDQNFWNKKIVGIMGASLGNIGTFGAQQHLRQVLGCLNAYIMMQPEFYLNASKAFDPEGKLEDKKIEQLIYKYLLGFNEWISYVHSNH